MRLENHKLPGLAVLCAALVASACSPVDQISETATGVAAVGAAQSRPATRAEIGEPKMSEKIDPPGVVRAGTVQGSYLGDEYPPGLEVPIAALISDLAGRFSVAETSIRVVAVEEVTWSDTSLGCPQPGMLYAQAVIDGMRVILEAEATLYDYRSGRTDASFLCARAARKGKS
jgi:hypothetical protein